MRGTVKSCKKPEDKTHYLLVIDTGESKPMFFNLHPKHNTEMYKVVRDTGIKWKDEVEFEYDDDGQWTVLTSLEKVGDAPKTDGDEVQSDITLAHTSYKGTATNTSIERQVIVKEWAVVARLLLESGIATKDTLIFETNRVCESFDAFYKTGKLEYLPAETGKEEPEK
jgi:hypothetical protein